MNVAQNSLKNEPKHLLPSVGWGVWQARGRTHKSDLDRADAPSSVKEGSERASERGVTGRRMGRVGWQARQKAVSQCQRQWVYSGEEKKKEPRHVVSGNVVLVYLKLINVAT